MSSAVATPPPPTTTTESAAQPAGPPIDAACPLCGAPLDPAQEWCLNCGAAARTRLAAPTNWKAPIVTIAAIAALALGVLAAALVKLSGGSGTTKAVAPITRTITVATTPTVAGAIPTTTAGAVTPGTPTTITPGGTPAPTSTGAVTPGTPTTLAPSTTTGAAGRSTTTAAPSTSTPATTTSTGASSTASEEALRKAGFTPPAKK